MKRGAVPLGRLLFHTLFPVVALDDLANVPEVGGITGRVLTIVVGGAGAAVGADHIPGAALLFQNGGAAAIRAILQFDFFVDTQCGRLLFFGALQTHPTTKRL